METECPAKIFPSASLLSRGKTGLKSNFGRYCCQVTPSRDCVGRQMACNVQGVARDVTRALVSRRKALAMRIRGVRESHIIVPIGVVMRGFSQQMCQLD